MGRFFPDRLCVDRKFNLFVFDLLGRRWLLSKTIEAVSCCQIKTFKNSALCKELQLSGILFLKKPCL